MPLDKTAKLSVTCLCSNLSFRVGSTMPSLASSPSPLAPPRNARGQRPCQQSPTQSRARPTATHVPPGGGQAPAAPARSLPSWLCYRAMFMNLGHLALLRAAPVPAGSTCPLHLLARESWRCFRSLGHNQDRALLRRLIIR